MTPPQAVIRVLSRARAPRSRTAAAQLTRLARRYLVLLGQGGVELSLSLVTDSDIRILNRQWRGLDQATDVLSFPAGPLPRPPGTLAPLGDVVISLETARARARAERRPLQRELARYLAHGLLHLLGHDHHRPAERRRMARAEAQLLGSAGLVALATGRRRRASR